MFGFGLDGRAHGLSITLFHIFTRIKSTALSFLCNLLVLHYLSALPLPGHSVVLHYLFASLLPGHSVVLHYLFASPLSKPIIPKSATKDLEPLEYYSLL